MEIQTGITSEKLAELRKEFPPEQIGKRPTVTCGQCRNAPAKVCDKHSKTRCKECGQWMTTAHVHIDYVGHADVTDRLLNVDPNWNWEPAATDEFGLPRFDTQGGLWIRLTVAGKTVLGYGAPSMMRGTDATKEAIGDAIRNAAMRLGVALSLWNGKFADMDQMADVDDGPDEPLADPATPTQKRKIQKLWATLGFVGEANLAMRIKLAEHTLGKKLPREDSVTCEDAAILINVLEDRVKQTQAAKTTKDSE